jgi:uncharacterized protein
MSQGDTMPHTVCSICQKPVAPRAENAAFPFCSRRCRAVPEQQADEREDELPAEHPERGSDA